MLPCGPAVHLRLRRSRCDVPKAPLCWRACNGMGYRCGRNHGEYRCSLYVFSFVFFLGGKTIVFVFRRVRQRLLPKTPGRDQRAVEPCACAWRFQRRILPSPLGDETRGIADVWLRGCVSRPLRHLVIFDLNIRSRGQSSIVAGLFLLTVPIIQLMGRTLRVGVALSFLYSTC